MSTSLDLDNLTILVGNIDADLDDVFARAPALVGIRHHIRLAQDNLRSARTELLAALELERNPGARDRQASVQ